MICSQHAVYSQTIDNFEPVQGSQTVMDTSGQTLLSGMYIDMYGIGADLIYRPEYSSLFGHMYAGSMWKPSRRIENSRQIYTAGVTIGKEWILTARSLMLRSKQRVQFCMQESVPESDFQVYHESITDR